MLAQIQEIDGQLSHAIESYNLANVKLDRIKGELKTNSQHLTIARSSLKAAQSHLSERLVALYKGGGSGGTLEVILAARSVEDLLNRIDAVDRVSAQDARVLREVKSFRAQVIERKGRLERAQQLTGAGRRRQGRAAQLDRGPARGAPAPALHDQGSDREPRGGGAAPPGTARGAGTGAPPRHAAAGLGRGGAAGARPVRLGRGSDRAGARRPLRRRRRDRDAVPRRPLRLGRREPVRLRLLRPDHVRLLARSASRCRTTRRRSTGWAPPVSRDQLQAGDLVFFNGLGHAGIYIGGGQFIHAPHSGDVVKISSLSDSWYARTWVGARRI